MATDWTISGRILKIDAITPFATLDGLSIQLFRDGSSSSLGNSGINDSDGYFSITLNKQQFQSSPDLIVRVFDAQNRLLYASGAFAPLLSEDSHSVGSIAVAKMPIPPAWNIHGIVFQQDGATPFTDGKIYAHGVRDDGSNFWLGEDGLINGDFTLTFARDNFQQGNVGIEAPKAIISVRDNNYALLWESSPFIVPHSEYYMNPLLGGSIVPNIPEVPENWSVSGVVLENGLPPSASLKVEAFDVLYGAETSLGYAWTDMSGAYSISYGKSAFQNGDSGRVAPNLLVKIFFPSGALAASSHLFIQAGNNKNIDIAFASDETNGGEESGAGNDSSVFGQVVNRKGLPLEKQQIKAYALNFASETGFSEITLGESLTDAQGRYAINYNSGIISGFAKAAIYAAAHYKEPQASGDDKNKIIASPLVYGAEKHQAFNFVLDGESSANITEFSELDAALRKYLNSILSGSAPGDEQKKLAVFLEHPTQLQLTANAESKEQRSADNYFRAFMIAYELQSRFAAAQNNQALPCPDGKYNALNYAQFFYALLRSGIISSSSDLLKQDHALMLNNLLGAVSEHIIAMDSDVRGFIDLWHEMFQTLSGDAPSNDEWTIYHVLLLALNGSLSTADATKNLIANLLGAYYDSGSDARIFLEAVRPIADSGSLLTEEQWNKIALILDLGDFCENYRDAIQASFLHCEGRVPKITDLKGMLALAESDWLSIVSAASSYYVSRAYGAASGTLPPEFTGADGAEQRAIYARKLYRGLLAWFPQAELAANIGPELAALIPQLSASELSEWNEASEFLSSADKPPFYLGSSNLGVYLQENSYIALSEAAQQKIRLLQRLFRLTEHLPSMAYLISKGIKSAYDIAQTSENRFLADFSVGLGGMNKARHIHRLAVNYAMSASLQVSQYHAGLSMRGESAPAVSRGLTQDGAPEPQAQSTNLALPRVSAKVVANWKTLFGAINRNAAIKGQSLLSPSAYLVDLLDFLKEGDGYDLLIKRRPDILNLKLSKQNAEVALPMIDLAIELLEKLAVCVPLSELNLQTQGDSEDLRAQPEHEPDAQAAALLLEALYPLNLPTNFSREEASLMLGKLGLSWRDLALAFPVSGGYRRRYLVTDEALDNILQLNAAIETWELWGLKESGNNLLRPDKSTPEIGSWDEILSVASIFLERSGLALEELESLLALPMFNGCGIKIAATSQAIQLGDIGGYRIEGINADFARKINRFVRLQRLLGWTPEELDAAWGLSLDELDQAQDLSKTLKIPVMQVIFWQREMTSAMFAQIFRPLLQNNAAGLIKIDDFANWANRCLGISQADMNLLLKHLQSEHMPETDTLTYSQAKQIYRLNSFAKAVKLSIGDFLDLAEWFSLLESAETWSLAECQQFYALAQELQTNPLSYASIKQLAFAPDKALLEKGTAFMLKLGKALDVIRDAHEIPEVSNETRLKDLQDATIACFAILGIDETEMVFLIQSVEKNSESLPEDTKNALKNRLQSFVEQEIIAEIDNNTLEAPTVEERLEALLSSLHSTVQERRRLAVETEVFAQVASHFALAEEIARRLLQDKMHNDTNVLAWLHSVNDSDAEETGKDALEDWMEVTETNSAGENGISLDAYMRLAKAAILVSSLKLNAVEQLDAWMPKEVDDILPDWNDFPIRKDAKPIDWDKFHPLLQALKVLKDLNFQKEGYNCLVTDASDELHQEKWNLRMPDLNALLAECGLGGETNATPAEWARFSQLLALFRKSCSLPAALKNVLTAIPVSANDESNASNYIKSVADLRESIRGSMSAASWREWIQPVSDGLRIRRRDALAAYVCWSSQQPKTAAYYPETFFDANDLYAYYLTDVEMEPDMSTSRIRQALNSAQQFTQRALLGLEGRFTLTEEQKGYWKWMKNYRVWEANRKVFLYAENWIEPELRDDKTPFFKELENKLMESSDNPASMEEALSEYLDKVKDVGGLQIVGACREDGNDSALYILHIVGCTRGDPSAFYRRSYLAKALSSGEWTPWEKIDTEIQAKSVSMAIMNGNLYIFWPDIQHKEEEAEASGGEKNLGQESPKSILDLRLNWIYFNGKKWHGKKTTKSSLSHVLYDSYGHKLSAGESYEDHFHFRTMNNSSDFIEVKVYRTWHDYDKLEPGIQRTKATDSMTTLKEVALYKPTEFQMIEEFGEFQLWKDGRDKAVYYGDNWSRENSSNYTNFYPPANCSLVHNFWADDGELTSYGELYAYSSEIRDREPQPPQKIPHGRRNLNMLQASWAGWQRQYNQYQFYLHQRKYAKLKEKEDKALKEEYYALKEEYYAWEKEYYAWEKEYYAWEEELKDAMNLANARARAADLADPSEFGKLVYPSKNIILNKIDGPYALLPVNFSFYTKEKLPFFFMGEDKTYLIEEVARDGGSAAGSNSNAAYRFNLLTHPLADEFHKRYRSGGREWLYTRETEALPMAEGYYRSYSYYNYYFSVYLGYHIAGDWEAWDLSQSLFDYRYQPSRSAVARPFPSPVVDFAWGSANGMYNWELFFHVPMLIAGKLTQEQRYEEAMDWMHMVFDPRMDLSVYERTKRWAQALPKGSRFWRFLPFFANKDADANILETLGQPGARDKTPEREALEALIDKWKRDPFNPHLIARARPAAYQKYVVMKYLDNLIAWADQLFAVDTMESLNEAVQLYMLAADILGPKEAATTEVDAEPLDVQTLMSQKRETLGNIMIRIEDDLIRVNDREKTVPQPKLSAEAGQLVGISGDMFYFGVPRNDKLQAYWGTVADRLYKIRNSLNIDGVKRTLALYEPPIDPAMLVRARAMGLDIGAALSAMSAPVPLYRFQVMLQKAMDIARDAQSLGASLLSALEKKDGESLSLMRAEHEREMLALNKSIRKLQIDEANAHLDSLQKSRESAETRYEFYKNIEKYSTQETLAGSLTVLADGLQLVAGLTESAAGAMAALPDMIVGAIANAFGGPVVQTSSGGSKASAATSSASKYLQISAQIARSGAYMAQTQGGYQRRWDEWKLQEKLAKKEMESLDKQILASEIRIYAAEKEMENLERQIEQSDEIYDFMASRFTSRELYTWMATQLGNLHKNTFQQALKAAQRAECCYKFELGIIDSYSPFIKLDYWDGLRQGLLAGEHLLYDLRLMESSFLEKNKREFEITRPVSLAQLNPAALRSLQEEGKCVFKVPEVLFDMDFPGQYFRRIQSVRLEIHCNADPYASISAKLSLLNNRLRISDRIDDIDDDSNNYLDNRIGIRSIATSQAQNDGGVFDLNFRDERYLPFEGAGAISEWRLELPEKYRQFDYQSISNVVLHISYTARDSGGLLKQAAIDRISGEKFVREIHLSRDYSDALQQLRSGQSVSLQISERDFPMFANGLAEVEEVHIFAKARNHDVDGFKLDFGVSTKTMDIKTNAWTEMEPEEPISIGVGEKFTLDASENGDEKLSNLGDIMIEYRYRINEED